MVANFSDKRKICMLFIVIPLLWCGCAVQNHYRPISQNIEEKNPEIKTQPIFQQRVREILNEYFTPKVQNHIQDSEIDVILNKQLLGSRGIYYPYFCGGINIWIGYQTSYSSFESIAAHEICHKIWFELLPTKQKWLFEKGWNKLDKKVRDSIDKHISGNYFFMFYPFAIWTERYSNVAEIILEQGVYYLRGKRTHVHLPQEILQAYKGLIKDKYLQNTTQKSFYKVIVRFQKNTDPKMDFTVETSIKLVPRLAEKGGVLLRCSGDTWVLYFAHLWTEPGCIIIYDVKTDNYTIYPLSDFTLSYTLKFEYISPPKTKAVFNHQTRMIINNRVPVRLVDIKWILENGLTFE